MYRSDLRPAGPRVSEDMERLTPLNMAGGEAK